MTPNSYITTSWDDGHPSDLRIADLLSRYGLRGTFYVPQTAPKGTLDAAGIRQLASLHEVGAHTLHHVDLLSISGAEARAEIIQSRHWLQDLTGQRVDIFCPPRGRYAPTHLPFMRQAGYTALRTVELLSIDPPRNLRNLHLLPTTVQVFSHSPVEYIKNALKRKSPANLWRCALYGRSGNWVTTARQLLQRTINHGGVFHLWGHAWEIDELQQWKQLEEVFRLLADHTYRAPAVTNAALVPTGATQTATPGRPVLSQSNA